MDTVKNFASKAGRTFVALALVLSSIIMLPKNAQAASMPTTFEVGDSYTGSCYVNAHTADPEPWEGTMSDITGVLRAILDYCGYGKTIDVDCLDHGYANPLSGSRTYYCEVTKVNKNTGKVTIMFYAKVTDPSYQRVGKGELTFDFNFTGSLKLIKKSNNTSITTNNNMYSLQGAKYGVYTSKADAKNDSDRVKTLTTDENGKTDAIDLTPDTYFVKETKAPSGYLLDDTVYKAVVKSGETTKVGTDDYVQDTPQVVDIADLMLEKYNVDTDKRNPPKGTFAGAIFKFTHYAANFSSYSTAAAAYTAAKASGAKSRTWYFTTDENGQIKFAKSYLSAGKTSSDFYTDSNKNICLPLGSLFVEEIQPPAHYLLNDEIKAEYFTYNSSLANIGKNVTCSQKIEVPETGEMGDFRLVKIASFADKNTSDEDIKNPVLVEGVKFEIYSLNPNATYSPEYKTNVEYGGLLCTIITDESGTASTKNDAVNGWSADALRAKNGGVLPYGDYRVHEVIPDDIQEKFKEKYGVELYAADDFEFSISEKEQYDAPILVNNTTTPPFALKIAKIDSETGKSIANKQKRYADLRQRSK